jgi:hypothetical protein
VNFTSYSCYENCLLIKETRNSGVRQKAQRFAGALTLQFSHGSVRVGKRRRSPCSSSPQEDKGSPSSQEIVTKSPINDGRVA